MLFSLVIVVVGVCAALGVLAWTTVAGAALVRNVAAIFVLAWEAVLALPAVGRVVRRRLTGARRP
jgi:hypothetical protein